MRNWSHSIGSVPLSMAESKDMKARNWSDVRSVVVFSTISVVVCGILFVADATGGRVGGLGRSDVAVVFSCAVTLFWLVECELAWFGKGPAEKRGVTVDGS